VGVVDSFVTLNDTITFTTTSYLTATPRWALILVIGARRHHRTAQTALAKTTDQTGGTNGEAGDPPLV
ncbi:hypothetical protein ABEJ45_06905, partial [Geobacillus thermoleovorans]